MATESLTECMERHVAEGTVPGIVVAVGRRGGTAAIIARGAAQLVPEREAMSTDTVFDLASVTKPVATATLAAQLIAEGALELHAPVSRYLSERAGDPEAAPTIAQLLEHTGGLPAWRPLYRDAATRDEMIAAVLAEPLVRPPGTEREYSCLGFIMLGVVIERVTGAGLDELVRERIAGPLAMGDTRMAPPAAMACRAAATEVPEGADAPLRGVVHDENARAMGGISGNAGLFSTASDLSRFARMMLSGGELDGAVLLSPAAMGVLFARDTSGPAGWNWRGWVGAAPGGAVAEILSTSAFGHTGFTGTSLWADPTRDLFIVCLTNGVHPRRSALEHIGRLRLDVYRAAAGAAEREADGWS
jgi:serine-type D-Ala-D-Ala carboxypeptidase